MTRDELLASVLRKLLESRKDTFGCYVSLDGVYLVMDGSLDLTQEEAQAVQEVLDETQAP